MVHILLGPPLNLTTFEEAAAVIINGGTDLEMGSKIFNSSMLSAVSKGLVTEATVTVAAHRNLLQRYDPIYFLDACSNGHSLLFVGSDKSEVPF